MVAKYDREAGFTLLSMLIVVAIIGIIATIAVPKFNSVLASANTAKIQADLSAIDSAIAVYEIDYGHAPASFESLDAYIDTANTKPPKGRYNLRQGTAPQELAEGETYSIRKVDARTRAVCAGHTAEEFGK